jgi:hypothetical protein
VSKASVETNGSSRKKSSWQWQCGITHGSTRHGLDRSIVVVAPANPRETCHGAASVEIISSSASLLLLLLLHAARPVL